MWKKCKNIWGFIADCFTAINIVEVFGLKQWLSVFAGGMLSSIVTIILQAPGWMIFGFWLAGAILTLLVFIVAHVYRNSVRTDGALQEKAFPVEGFVAMRSAAGI